MGLIVDLKELKTVLEDMEALTSGPIKIEVSAPIRIVITAANGKQVLDATIMLNVPGTTQEGKDSEPTAITSESSLRSASLSP
jgi:hypothetical protein